VLEYGCNVGTLTLFLAELVGTEGRVYATSISQRQIRLVEKRLAKKGINHVDVLHDPQHHSRVHPSVPDVDIAVSVGGMGYVQDLLMVLHGLNKRLDVGDKVCFVDYDKFFDVIPNIDWLSNNDEIRRIFKECGFNVDVKRKQGFAWQYIFIFGEKEKDLVPK
jgi:cyclopropane fatty-acyl-phospholipid synthase-like methyltransferase